LYTSAETTTTSTDWHELARKTITPDTSGDVIAVTCSVFDGDGTNRKSYARTQVGGISSPNTQPDNEYACNLYDGSSRLPIGGITKFAGVASTASSVHFDAKKTVSTDIGWLNTTLALFTTEIAITNTNQVFSAVASQTYNSGEVAGQSFSAGDVIGQVQPK
jgi:hypothetical protein